ncbi:MAG TPA: xylose isomerase, partial [Deltaproteobacteria bacterium]|nr:xylose isomerase [Deltaproteobacteria bacterium]
MTTLRVANAPCSWGVLEFDDADGGLLAGPSPDCDQVLREIRSAGFVGTELGDWGFMPTEPGPLRDLLQQHQLAMLAAFVPVALKDAAAHRAGVDEAVRTARLLASVNSEAFIVLADDNGTVEERTRLAGRIGSEQGLDAREWALFA